MLASFVLPTSF
jgi:hypothetical protein